MEAYLCTWPAAQQVTVHERTCCAIVRYEGDRQELLTFLSRFSYTSTEIAQLAPTHTGRALNREYQEKLVMKIVSKALRSALLRAFGHGLHAVSLRSLPGEGHPVSVEA